MSFFATFLGDIRQGFDFMFGGNHADARAQALAKAQTAVATLKALISTAEAEGLFGTAERATIVKAEGDLDSALAALATNNGADTFQNVLGAMNGVIALLPAQYRAPAMVAQAAVSVLLPTLLAAAPVAAAA